MAFSFRVRGGREAHPGTAGWLSLPGQDLQEQRETATSGRRQQVRMALPSMAVVPRPAASGQDAVEEVADVLGDGLQVALEGEVAGLEQVDLGVG